MRLVFWHNCLSPHQLPYVVKLMDDERVADSIIHELRYRFVLTLGEKEMEVPEDVRDCFAFVGKVDVSECPYRHEQSDIMNYSRQTL